MSKPVASLTAADFEPHRGESFHVARAATAELELKLVEVQRRGDAVREGGAFSLLFLSAAGPFLPQSIYTIAHPALGTLELFFVPLGPQQGGNLYEVIFT